jgi:two-component system chemotaxis response regulator CheY
MPYSELTFLVVDDFSTMRRIIKNILRKLGVTTIYEAENGEEALKVLNNQSIDFILTDWNMPVMSGLDFLIAARKSKQFKHLRSKSQECTPF